MALRILPGSWREVARPFLIAFAVLVILVLGAAASDVLGRRTEWILFCLVGAPLLGLSALSSIWLKREFDAEAATRGWDRKRRRKERLRLWLLGPLYLWLLRRSFIAQQ